MNKDFFVDPFQNENDDDHSSLIFAILKHKKHVRIFIEESQASLKSISAILQASAVIKDTSEIFRKIHNS